MSVCIPCIFRYFDDLGIIILPFAFALRFFELQTAPWKPQGNQRVIESSSWVSWVLGKWNLVSSAPFEMIGCFFHVFEPSYSWEHIHTIFWLERPILQKKKEQFCTVNLQNKANILNNICSFCLTNSRGVNLWHSTISARKWVQVQSHAVRVSKLTNETTASSKCILQKSNMAMENYPFGCFPRSPSFSAFLAGHDYRSVATGHQAPPFSRATIFTAVSHPWRVRSMKRGYSNAKKTTVPTWGNQDGSWVYSQFGK